MPQGIDIVFLGTAGSVPTKERSMPSVAVIYDGSILLFDCGEGTQIQMLKYGLNAQRLKAIFISHIHGDHTIGIAGIVRSLAINGRKEALSIFVPRGSERIIRSLIVFDRVTIGYPINIIGVRQGTVYRGRGFSVSAFRLNHTVETYGYAVAEDSKLRFIKERCDRLGIRGTMYSELEKKGIIRINGKGIRLKGITRLQEGRKIVYATDTRPAAGTVRAARGADLLIHEASYKSSEKALAVSRKHSTSEEAAGIARKAKVSKLTITHFSARYRDASQLLSEAKAVFKNTIAASDGYRITL